MAPKQSLITTVPLARGKIAKEGHFTDRRGPRYSIGRKIAYRQRGGQWQVCEERYIYGVCAHSEDFTSWKRKIEAQVKGLAEKTITLDIEHGYYEEKDVRIVIAGWRPAVEREVKMIERQLHHEPDVTKTSARQGKG